MAVFCFDANVTVALLIPNPSAPRIREFWMTLSKESDRVIGPAVLLPECTSVLRQKAFDRLITHTECTELVNRLIELPISIDNNPHQFQRAVELAQRTNRRKAYDMQYLAVAELTGAELVTLDGGLRQAAIERRVPVRFLR